MTVLPKKAKYSLSYKCLIYYFRSSPVKIDIPGDGLLLKQTERTCWTIQTHSEELNRARRQTFHELNLVRLMKSSTFGLGLNDILK